MKKSFATKKKIEQLAALAVGDGQQRSTALRAMVSLTEHRKQYNFAVDAAAQCLVIGKTHGEKVLRQYLEELKSMSASEVTSVDSRTRRIKEIKSLNEISMAPQAATHKSTVEDKLFALVTLWSEKNSPANLAEQVSITEEIVADCIAEEKKEDDGSESNDCSASINETEEAADFPLSMLLELATKRFHEEYKSVLSESQMSFIASYISNDPEQFIVKVLMPLEEKTKQSIRTLTGDSEFGSDQLSAISMLLESFQTDRSFVSNVSHPQHHAAVDFYLSLVDLTEKINSKDKQE